MPYGDFPNVLKVIDLSTGEKFEFKVKNWEEVKRIQELRYEILAWGK